MTNIILPIETSFNFKTIFIKYIHIVSVIQVKYDMAQEIPNIA